MQEQLTFKHAYVCQPPAQVVLPSVIWGHLWDEDPVSSAGLGCHKGQVPADISCGYSNIGCTFSKQVNVIFSFLNKSTDPQCLPITSRINVLWWLRVEEYGHITADVCFSFSQLCHGGWGDLCAVVVMASTTSMMRCRAESVPMVMSVPQKSLSMEPTMPTMFRWEDFFASCSVILPVEEGSGITVDPNATLNSSFSTVNLLWSRDYLLARGQPAAHSTQS